MFLDSLQVLLRTLLVGILAYAGISAVEGVAAVVLETGGTFSVLQQWDGPSRTAFADVPEFSPERQGEKG